MLLLQKTNNIPTLLASFHRASQTTVKDTTHRIAEDAKNRAPFASGELHDSISDEASELSGEVIVDSDHALFIEIGTEHQAAHPFLTPAVIENSDGFFSRIAEGLK